MTQQVERNTLKAVDQLNRFAAQPSATRDAVCSRLVGRKVRGVRWTPVVLSRSGLGTARAWSALDDAVPLNVALLRWTVRRLKLEGRSLDGFGHVANDLLDMALQRTVRRWRHESVAVFGTSMTIPLLDLDEKEMLGLRHDLN
jgi:hypothetical protein